MFGIFKKKPPPAQTSWPPVPTWRPKTRQPLSRIVERVSHYTNGVRDFVTFEYGTCVLVESGQAADQAILEAKAVLSKIVNYHPDMTPAPMKDGNIVVQYRHPALNVVLADIADANWVEIDENYLGALAPAEVLNTPLGPNKFDEFGKKALFGRCFMFMDAIGQNAVQVVRAANLPSLAPNQGI